MNESTSLKVRRRVAAGTKGSRDSHLSVHLNHSQVLQMQKKKRDFLTRINYGLAATVVVLPLIAVIYCWRTRAVPLFNTWMFSIWYHQLTILSFTAGYHKFFAHNSFKVRFVGLAYFFVIFGSSIGLGSARWWAGLHRAHHRHTDDTERDPYLIKRGFLWAHWGWLLKKPKSNAFYEEFLEKEFPKMVSESRASLSPPPSGLTSVVLGETPRSETPDIDETIRSSIFSTSLENILGDFSALPDASLQSNLVNQTSSLQSTNSSSSEGNLLNLPQLSESNFLSSYPIKDDSDFMPLLIWQERYYYPIFLTTTILIPAIVAIILKDSIINFIVFGGILRMFLIQQQLLSVESVCHYKTTLSLPTQPFSDKNSLLDCTNPLVTFLTYGQAYQNYHHEFPHDYRATYSMFAFDPTKWFLTLLSVIGVVEDLGRTPTNLVSQLKLQQQQLVLNRIKSSLNWGTPILKLPLVVPRDFKRLVAAPANKDKIFIVIQNVIHDITPFMEKHPGGAAVLKASHGKDATAAFFGGVYRHLAAASNLLSTMRIGMLDVGNEEEVWGRVVKEEGGVEEGRVASSRTANSRTAEAA